MCTNQNFNHNLSPQPNVNFIPSIAIIHVQVPAYSPPSSVNGDIDYRLDPFRLFEQNNDFGDVSKPLSIENRNGENILQSPTTSEQNDPMNESSGSPKSNSCEEDDNSEFFNPEKEEIEEPEVGFSLLDDEVGVQY